MIPGSLCGLTSMFIVVGSSEHQRAPIMKLVSKAELAATGSTFIFIFIFLCSVAIFVASLTTCDVWRSTISQSVRYLIVLGVWFFDSIQQHSSNHESTGYAVAQGWLVWYVLWDRDLRQFTHPCTWSLRMRLESYGLSVTQWTHCITQLWRGRLLSRVAVTKKNTCGPLNVSIFKVVHASVDKVTRMMTDDHTRKSQLTFQCVTTNPNCLFKTPYIK